MSSEGERELLCFSGRRMTYAVDFADVVELCEHIPVEKIPCLPEYFCGISNYKGNIVSVLSTEKTRESNVEETVLLVDSGEYQFGICIDGAPWICSVEDEEIEDVSESVAPGNWKEKTLYRTDTGRICLLDLLRSARGLAEQ